MALFAIGVHVAAAAENAIRLEVDQEVTPPLTSWNPFAPKGGSQTVYLRIYVRNTSTGALKFIAPREFRRPENGLLMMNINLAIRVIGATGEPVVPSLSDYRVVDLKPNEVFLLDYAKLPGTMIGDEVKVAYFVDERVASRFEAWSGDWAGELKIGGPRGTGCRGLRLKQIKGPPLPEVKMVPLPKFNGESGEDQPSTERAENDGVSQPSH